MRALVQRVTSASVRVEDEVIGAIDCLGLLVLLGVTHTDTPATADALADKVWNLRILHGERSCADLNAPLLAHVLIGAVSHLSLPEVQNQIGLSFDRQLQLVLDLLWEGALSEEGRSPSPVPLS